MQFCWNAKFDICLYKGRWRLFKFKGAPAFNKKIIFLPVNANPTPINHVIRLFLVGVQNVRILGYYFGEVAASLSVYVQF
jgi:hypothetical protein